MVAMAGLSLSFPLLFVIFHCLLVIHCGVAGATDQETGRGDAPLAGHIARGLALERDTAAGETASVEVFVRPPFPLANGTTYQPLASSATTSTLRKGASDGPAGLTASTPTKSQNASLTLASDYAVFDGTSFKTMCSSTDAGCRDQCTALARSCETRSEAWSSSIRAWDSSWDSKIGASTWPISTSTSTILRSKVWTSHYSITYITTHMTTNPGLVGTYEVAWTSRTLANPACSTEECEKSERSITLTSAISSRAGNIWQTLTASDAYAVNGSAWGYSALPQSEYHRTYHITMRPPFPDPEPSCAFSQTRSCAVSPDCNKCTITGGTVELLYFPIPRTTSPSNHTTAAPNIPVTAVFQNLTMTSPSVYISFQTAYAENQCGTRIGGHYPGAILELPPHELSSVFGGYGTLYSHVGDPFAPQSRTPYLKGGLFDLRDLEWPTPYQVYVNQLKYAVGGEVFNGVIFDDYRPQLVVPTSIRGLDPAWQSCALDWEGLYDPPKALQPGTAIATPTRPATRDPYTPAAPSATPTKPATQTARPESAVPLMVIVKPSALPQSKSSPTEGGGDDPTTANEPSVAAPPASGTLQAPSSQETTDTDALTQQSADLSLSTPATKPTTMFSYAPKSTEESLSPEPNSQQTANAAQPTEVPEPRASNVREPASSGAGPAGASAPAVESSAMVFDPSEDLLSTGNATPLHDSGAQFQDPATTDDSAGFGIPDRSSSARATEQEPQNALSVLVEAGGARLQPTAPVPAIGTHKLTPGGSVPSIPGETQTPERTNPSIPTTLPDSPKAQPPTPARLTLSTNVPTAIQRPSNPNATVPQNPTLPTNSEPPTPESGPAVVSLRTGGGVAVSLAPASTTSKPESGVHGAGVPVALPSATVTAGSVPGGVGVAGVGFTVGGEGPGARGGRWSDVGGGGGRLVVGGEGGSSIAVVLGLESGSGWGSATRSLLSLPGIARASSSGVVEAGDSGVSETGGLGGGGDGGGDEGKDGVSGDSDAESAAVCSRGRLPSLGLSGLVVVLLWAVC